jgi:hypothetical protein
MEPILALASAAIWRVEVPSNPFRPNNFNAERINVARVASGDNARTGDFGVGLVIALFNQSID